jgi:hypothetical protein
MTLPLATGRKAGDARELLHGIRDLSESVVYHHTHRFLQEHQFLVPEPPNDFAYWATEILQDKKLGEMLAAIDPLAYGSLAELKAAFVEALEGFLSTEPTLRRAPPGEEFHFVMARRFSVPTPHHAESLPEFAVALRKVSISSLFLHLYEARLRAPAGVNDFALWFDRDLSRPDLARQVAALDLYSHTLEELREQLVSLVETAEATSAPT